MTSCSSCGAPVAASDRFCANCGTPATAPPLPRSHHAALVTVVAFVLLVAGVALAGTFLVLVYGGQPGTGQLLAIGLTVQKTSDGLYWNVTFTAVPAGTTQNATTLALRASSGATLLAATSLFQLEGSGVNGVRYVPWMTGATLTDCLRGDHLLIAFGAGSGQYPAGTRYEIVHGGMVYATGTLQ